MQQVIWNQIRSDIHKNVQNSDVVFHSTLNKVPREFQPQRVHHVGRSFETISSMASLEIGLAKEISQRFPINLVGIFMCKMQRRPNKYECDLIDSYVYPESSL